MSLPEYASTYHLDKYNYFVDILDVFVLLLSIATINRKNLLKIQNCTMIFHLSC